MLKILLLIFASYYPAYESERPEPQQVNKQGEVGDCEQLPPQKILDAIQPAKSRASVRRSVRR